MAAVKDFEELTIFQNARELYKGDKIERFDGC